MLIAASHPQLLIIYSLQILLSFVVAFCYFLESFTCNSNVLKCDINFLAVAKFLASRIMQLRNRLMFTRHFS